MWFGDMRIRNLDYACGVYMKIFSAYCLIPGIPVLYMVSCGLLLMFAIYGTTEHKINTSVNSWSSQLALIASLRTSIVFVVLNVFLHEHYRVLIYKFIWWTVCVIVQVSGTEDGPELVQRLDNLVKQFTEIKWLY